MFDCWLAVSQPSFVHPSDSYIFSLISIIEVKHQFNNHQSSSSISSGDNSSRSTILILWSVTQNHALGRFNDPYLLSSTAAITTTTTPELTFSSNVSLRIVITEI